MSAADSDYALNAADSPRFPAPELPYLPQDPAHYRPGIAVVGTGGISATHLQAYRNAGYDVVALCDLDRSRAEQRRAEFYPQAVVTTELQEVLDHPGVHVIDAATHPQPRAAIIEAALRAGKHVLSQKPFVTDLDEGQRLADLADALKLRLAINQNARWAPYLSYVRQAVKAGLIGEVVSVHASVHWDHTWVAGTSFEDIDDLIFYDFVIHWFDYLASLVGPRARMVHASRARATGQTLRPPLLAQALIELEGGQASLIFDGHARFGPLNSLYVAGTHGTLTSQGPDLGRQTVTLHTAQGHAIPQLSGQWFPDGFHGAMGELLRAIEEDRVPDNNAHDNLQGLGLCFAAIAASHDGQPRRPGAVRTLPSFQPR